jgi:hypothetical protein
MITKEQEDEFAISNTMRLDLITKKRTMEYLNFLMASHAEDIRGFLETFGMMLSHCLTSGNIPLMKELHTWGKNIKKQIEILDIFVENGGKVYERNSTSVPGGSPSSPKDTGREGDIP